MNNKLEHICKVVMIVQFKVLTQHFSAGTNKNHEICSTVNIVTNFTNSCTYKHPLFLNIVWVPVHIAALH